VSAAEAYSIYTVFIRSQ